MPSMVRKPCIRVFIDWSRVAVMHRITVGPWSRCKRGRRCDAMTAIIVTAAICEDGGAFVAENGADQELVAIRPSR